MHILAIGDVHGRDTWKQIKDHEVDQIIFIGDYVDPHRPIPDFEVLRNLEEIIAFKQNDPDRITLLLGNHDAQYLHYPRYSCSGQRVELQETVGRLFQEKKALFQIAWQRDRYLFTHAGISQGWYDRHLVTLNEFDRENVAAALNAIHTSEHRDILFEVGRPRGGWHRYGGPIWADQSETQFDYLAGFHQVVGHSRVKNFEFYGDANASITYTDVGDTRVRFYTMSE